MLLTRSLWLKTIVTVVAIGGFISLYEVTMRDAKKPDPKAPPAPGDRISISTTAYCKGNVTAAGVSAQNGAAASDRNLLPLGSIVQIATGDARYDGMYTILDTGPEIKGREIDIYMWSCNEALAFGRKTAQVTLMRRGWIPRAIPPKEPTLLDRLLRRSAPAPPPEPLSAKPLPSRPFMRAPAQAHQPGTPATDASMTATPGGGADSAADSPQTPPMPAGTAPTSATAPAAPATTP